MDVHMWTSGFQVPSSGLVRAEVRIGFRVSAVAEAMADKQRSKLKKYKE